MEIFAFQCRLKLTLIETAKHTNGLESYIPEFVEESTEETDLSDHRNDDNNNRGIVEVAVS